MDGALSLVDLGSTNGTWVDEVRVAPITETGSVPVVLRAGSRLRLANVELEIVLDAR